MLAYLLPPGFPPQAVWPGYCAGTLPPAFTNRFAGYGMAALLQAQNQLILQCNNCFEGKVTIR